MSTNKVFCRMCGSPARIQCIDIEHARVRAVIVCDLCSLSRAGQRGAARGRKQLNTWTVQAFLSSIDGVRP